MSNSALQFVNLLVPTPLTGYNIEQLADVDLGHNNIGCAGATALADALYKNDTLHSLSLDNNPIR